MDLFSQFKILVLSFGRKIERYIIQNDNIRKKDTVAPII